MCDRRKLLLDGDINLHQLCPPYMPSRYVDFISHNSPASVATAEISDSLSSWRVLRLEISVFSQCLIYDGKMSKMAAGPLMADSPPQLLHLRICCVLIYLPLFFSSLDLNRCQNAAFEKKAVSVKLKKRYCWSWWEEF